MRLAQNLPAVSLKYVLILYLHRPHPFSFLRFIFKYPSWTSCLCTYISTGHLLGLGRFFSFLIFYTVCRVPWTGDQPVARPLPAHTGEYKDRTNAHRQPCLEWDSNTRSQHSSERICFMSYTARPVGSAIPVFTFPLFLCSLWRR
jgi:hypothetical protein